MFPLIPLACVAGFVASSLGFGWYCSMSKEEQDKADRLAADYAWQLYKLPVNYLTQQQSDRVAALVRSQLGN